MDNKKSVSIKRTYSEIKENLLTELKQEPTQVKEWFVDNVFSRCLSYMVGFTEGGKAVKLKVTNSGIIKTAHTGGGFESVEVLEGTATGTLSSKIDFDSPVNRLRFVGLDYDMYVSTSVDGVVFYDPIYIIAGDPSIIDIICASVKVQRAGTNNSQYRIEGYR